MASEEMAIIMDMAGFFRVVKDCGMKHVVFLGMYFALRIGSIRFIAELNRLFKAVEEMKGTLIESGMMRRTHALLGAVEPGADMWPCFGERSGPHTHMKYVVQ